VSRFTFFDNFIVPRLPFILNDNFLARVCGGQSRHATKKKKGGVAAKLLCQNNKP